LFTGCDRVSRLQFIEVDTMGKLEQAQQDQDEKSRDEQKMLGRRARSDRSASCLVDMPVYARIVDSEAPSGSMEGPTFEKNGQAKATAPVLTRVVSHSDHHRKEQSHILSRVEFLVALVKVAINRFVRTREIPDVSRALDELIGVVIQSKLAPNIILDPDIFRRGYCYSEAVCTVLKKNKPTLHDAFSWLLALAKELELRDHRHSTQSLHCLNVAGVQTIGLATWMCGLQTLEIIGEDLSTRDALRCFSWSRMVVVDYKSQIGDVKDSMLPLESFMEAICRMAALKALPTESDLATIPEARGAGEWLGHLRDRDPQEFHRFLRERAVAWGEIPSTPFHVRVQQTIDIWQAALKRGTGMWLVRE